MKWDYFHIFWLPIGFSKEYHLLGENRLEDKIISQEEVEKMFPGEELDLNLFQKWGLLIAVAIIIIISLFSQ